MKYYAKLEVELQLFLTSALDVVARSASLVPVTTEVKFGLAPGPLGTCLKKKNFSLPRTRILIHPVRSVNAVLTALHPEQKRAFFIIQPALFIQSRIIHKAFYKMCQ